MTDKLTSDQSDRYNAVFTNQANHSDQHIDRQVESEQLVGAEMEQPEVKHISNDQGQSELGNSNHINNHPVQSHLSDSIAIKPEQSAKQLNDPEKTVLSIAELGFSYADRADVLQGLNLQVSAGEKIGLIGPNGAGKTTLFLIICGVLSATSGQVNLFGEAIAPGKFRSEIGLVFQNPNDQLFSASVWDDVAFGPINMGMTAQEVTHCVQAALELTGVADLAQRPPHHLSGGEKRMVAIASVLACGPQLIIYDEPSANLDIRSRRRLIEFLQASNATRLVCSHDLELILELCDRVILLDEGKIVADGRAIEIMGDRNLMHKHGLERPHSLEHLNPDGHSH
ncbi:Fe(3+)-transporting ATPase [Thalassoporum mexicanum PCC 7367]|uniref:energy-coupling factor ABC transporter ATP-binding protein n=1 Tax=Thalassoporum mexicanum TaxID=3457544 RepID=UPI00029F873D|nr:ABC transporter ATP-binding protein [Pseudanabaena sp. PCC 7367]AFY70861.1 Fe(3+)-transporting ATPase [Pseudanabaena sp. PCC 7367]